ncbi:protein ANTAGONIST OF LIKE HETEROCHROMATIN PROTEIN 1 [Aristolochia californica]|uniref:protein ANTAGONIST OF LIKE HETEROCHROMATIN PROTEIN 1 n=1 Tax=Aristolochia californica TaxID=171875 RepID=UPI0035DF6E41
MDPSLLLMLSNLLHLQNHLDPSSSLLSPPTSVPLSSSSAAPLLFFTLASVLSYASSLRSSSSPTSSSSSSPSRLLSLDPTSRDANYRESYSVSYPVFSSLLDLLRPYFLRANLSLSPEIALSIALSRLARGASPNSIARQHSLDPFLVSKITNMVTRLLATKVFPEYVKIPTGQRLIQTVQSFKEISSLPNICGAIDSSPIKLARLPHNADPAAFRSRHNFPAIHLQAAADHRKIFWDVCVKAAGPTDDATHFRDSLLYHRLTSAEILRDSVVTVKGHHVRPYLVGDWCYPLFSFLLTPFSSNATGTPAQNHFDAALMRARSMVEQAIGLLKSRWRILQNLSVGLDHAAQTIVACCVLHNICQVAGEPEPALYKDPKEIGPPARVLESEKSFYYFGESLRQAMADDLQERHQRLSSR